ncbi:hypothetical protein LNTAR_19217 [Lentisphaera araneosa HTCC2155]|uniref:Uncharacterized protein n=1 Tax=Lentisphaera araneosa HTCC2155 TaxID=313628 RepID=A6DQQ9_9BACT|nr:hypothetical protein [Lentisphaera araneosa]EDM25959.1 hypothetical protein LNTAR_19217 [Lentisphaera araneosa HTCC2155]
MTKRKKIILILITCSILSVITYRFYTTLSFIATGIYERSPNASKVAHIHEHNVEHFWGGDRNYSTIKIKDKNGKLLKYEKHEHGTDRYNWYSQGKIIWTSEQNLEFKIKDKTIIEIELNKP